MLGRLTGAARRIRSALGAAPPPPPPKPAPPPTPMERYVAAGRIPWSDGYTKFKNQLLAEVLADDAMLDRFADEQALPDDYAPRLDERVVEYPWVLSRLRSPAGPILDAGSTFLAPLVLDLPFMQGREIVVYTLETDAVIRRPGVSLLYGDLRTLSLVDDHFAEVVCISTLEHVGMAQSFSYSALRPYEGATPDDALLALRELRRVLRPGGRLLLTIPFGRREDHGWLQQFDTEGIRRLVEAFDGEVRSETYYRYDADGWRLADAAACADASYFNIHATPTIEPDGAAAARAVCCLEFVKPA